MRTEYTVFEVTFEPEELKSQSYTFVAQGFKLTEDARTVDAILDSATSKGHDIRYVSSFYGVAPGYYEIMRKKVLEVLKGRVTLKCEYDAVVEPKACIVVRE